MPPADAAAEAVLPLAIPPAPAGRAATAPDQPSLGGLHGEWLTDTDVRSRLRLSGMHCAACAGLIEALLLRQPGVRAAQVSPSTQRLTLDWSPADTSLEHLRRELRRAGYDCAPDLPTPARELRRREHRQAIWRLFVAGFLMMQVMMLAWPAYVAAPGEMTPDVQALLRWGQWVLTLPVMLMAAGPFFQAAWTQLRSRRLGMDVPVVVGLTVAFVAGTGATLDPTGPFGHEVYFDSITMFVAFLLAARYLELRARHRAMEALEEVGQALPDQVERLRADGGSDWVAAEALQPGDQVRVPAGQRIPADALVVHGQGAVDESLLSGESRPVSKSVGDEALAGSINLHGVLVLSVRRVGAATRLSGLQRLMEQAFQERPTLLKASDRMAGVFLAGVLTLALGAALAWQFIDPSRAVAVAVSVLIVTCPCALSLAAPAAWVAAAGRLARQGLLLSRLESIESLARITHVVIDKTGTLTDTRLALAAQWPATLTREEGDKAFALAAASHHPLSRALLLALQGLREKAQTPGALERASAAPAGADITTEHIGRGLETTDANGDVWRLGSARWASESPVALSDAQLVLACNGVPRAAWRFDEQLREDAGAAVAACQALGLPVTLLSGDQPARVALAAERAGIRDWQGGASPEDKLAHVARLQQQGEQVLMLGDGINDAPVLARAQASIAMGQGADLAKVRADALLVQPRLSAVPQALALSRRTVKVVRQNLAWALVYNTACVPMALAGWLPPWAAGLGMALSSCAVIANAARLGRGASAPAAPAAPAADAADAADAVVQG
ncbi:heavy metal translocating P-type ATPase [Roseateles depolymerans]|uniref:Putative cation transport P-type ATPase n=1 Tax=Roseateles depolymerans TaxID=76731 RepID=A0A0U3N0Q6_9BURK|nr:cation-translocating P-type ATPase [Roseateles depolymerans]ALV07764.1 Putative cation transport P-type ATPase [Roseateles depolymerans]REG22015.1 Cu2+-exporting ATPase [Roseateles depolymerans]